MNNQKILKLRKLINSYNLDGYIIPKNDAYFSEFALPDRLKIIFNELCLVIEKYSPQEAAIEEVFMGRNASSALKLGQARGSAMVACLSRDLPVAEYSARKVKQAVVGTGGADKLQVQHMVKALLSISDKIAEDAADGLAIAICHANTQASLIKMAGAKSFSRKRLHR